MSLKPPNGITNVPACAVTASANQSIPNGVQTALSWDTEEYDQGSLHSTVTNANRLTASSAGIYLVSATVAWASSTTGARQVILRANGTGTGLAFNNTDAGGTSPQQSVSCLARLAAGGYVEVLVSQTSGGALNVLNGTDLSRMSMAYLGS